MKLLKSKTLDFNIILAALSGVIIAFGIPVPPEIITSFAIIGNFLLRFITKVPLSEK